MKEKAVLEAKELTKIFPSPAGELTVLDALQLEVSRGEMLAIVGPSGVGKSTLLYLLAGLDQPTRGDVFFDNRPLSQMTPDELARHRNTRLGFLWQSSNLLPDFTARENVLLPRLLGGASHADAAAAADHWLAEVGLADRASHLAGELSGGEQQRAALARALVNEPALLLADEPTGNLDAATSEQIFALLVKLHKSHALTSVLATHNLDLAARCDRCCRLQGGKLFALSRSSSAAEGGGERGADV